MHMHIASETKGTENLQENRERCSISSVKSLTSEQIYRSVLFQFIVYRIRERPNEYVWYVGVLIPGILTKRADLLSFLFPTFPYHVGADLSIGFILNVFFKGLRNVDAGCVDSIFHTGIVDS